MHAQERMKRRGGREICSPDTRVDKPISAGQDTAVSDCAGAKIDTW